MVPSHGMGATGFGYYKMNLLAPLDSRGWSEFLPALGGRRGEREGFNYLGLGGLLLVISAAVVQATRRIAVRPGVRTVMLLLLAVALTVVAITHKVGVGGLQFSIPVPQRLEALLELSPIQSTGRLFWVVYYLLLFAAMFVLGRALGTRWLLSLLAFASVMQLVDLYPGLRDLRYHSAATGGSPRAKVLTTPFWEQAADKYARVRRLPARIGGDGWEHTAFYAQRHGMATDVVKLARVDWHALSAAQVLQHAHLVMGRPEADALYLLDDDHAELAKASLTEPEDALFRLDGFNVLAPSWGPDLPEGAAALRRPCAGGVCDTPSVFRLPFRSDFAPASRGRLLLGDGWYADEAGRVRFRDTAATIFIPGGARPSSVDVTLGVYASGADKYPVASVDVYEAHERIAGIRIADSGVQLLTFRVPPSAEEGRFRRIVLIARRLDGRYGGDAPELRIDLDRLEAEAAKQ
jgi:hypothetical protein